MARSRRLNKADVGTYNRICDKSGFVFKRSELIREEKTNLLVHPKYADPEHPSDRPYPPIVEQKVKIE